MRPETQDTTKGIEATPSTFCSIDQQKNKT